ncbi:class I SAM-dependent methyltransferase [bacterium]|nr:MAG: class I SAM-dependent methyltransferase [bacterium]
MISQEEINCPICGSSKHSVFLKSKDFRFGISNDTFQVVKCHGCGFLFLNPRPIKSSIGSFYPADFNQRDRSFLYKIIEPYFKITQKSTINLLQKYKNSGKVLDIGCGNGDFVFAMLKTGYDAWGVEPNPGSERLASKQLKGRILYKDLQECNFAIRTFDIITLFQSLEHIHDLNELFREIGRIAKDDAILYICVPNTDFFEFRIFGPYAYNLEVPRHLYFFTPETLSKLLEKNRCNAIRFIRNSLFESVCTPASFYHSIVNFFNHRGIIVNNLFKVLIFIPAVFLRFIIRILFFFDDQNLKVMCARKCI